MGKMSGKTILLFVVVFICYVILGAILPFVKQPEVTEETKENFDAAQFYGMEYIGERAAVIPDNGDALKERIRLISHARERIILSTFQFSADESGKDMLAALQAAAERGVKVSILTDGMPGLISMEGNSYFYALSVTENVEIRLYNPVNLLTPWKLMGRLHDKYLIVDETAYIVGGRNTYDYFLGDGPGYKNYDWDVLVYCERGEADSLNRLEEYYENIWNQPDCRDFHGKTLTGKLPGVKNAKEKMRERYAGMQEEHPDWFEACDYEAVTKPVKEIRLITNPTSVKAKEPLVYYEMTQLMKNAKKEVCFHTPYILCDDWMLEQLTEICGQVETVTMMTNSVANNGNPFGTMDYAKNKGDILDTGVNILEYDGGVSYHGKCFTIDDDLVGIGSFNWDMRSTYMDTEMMLVINSEELNADMKQEMERYEAEALTVIDENISLAPEGMMPQEISWKKALQIKLLQIFGGWARFLM